jgi:3-oxoacyl-[acyl-carrier-protein] synthase II
MKKRIVITGTGVIASNGIGTKEFWTALLHGKDGLHTIKSFDTSLYKNHYACEVLDNSYEKFCPSDHIYGKAARMILAGTRMALQDAGIKEESDFLASAGIVTGTGLGEINILEKINARCVKGEDTSLHTHEMAHYPPQMISSIPASELGLRGPNLCITTACSSGNDALIYALHCLGLGKTKIMIAAGADVFSRIAFTGFSRLNSLAPEMCTPFDLNRKGITVGEGCGVLVLETLDHALGRGAGIYAEIAGYGTNNEAYHITAPSPDVESGTGRCIQRALDNAQLSPGDVGYICAHGTGTKANDMIETKAIKSVFKEKAYTIPVTSIKSMIGHTGGAAAALGAITCVLAIQSKRIPPTMNYTTADPECDLDYVVHTAKEMDVRVALNNSFAFGGNNSCLVLKQYSPAPEEQPGTGKKETYKNGK